MGLFSLFKKTPAPPSPVPTSAAAPSAPQKLSFAEKERLAVQRATLQDLHSLVGFPYLWNGKLEKYFSPNAHPFAYMDLIGPNIVAAQRELAAFNQHIEHAKKLCPAVPKSLQIPINDIYFRRSSVKGYTRLICSPVTHTGDPSEFPVSLSFMTDLDKESNTTHGDLFYDRIGKVAKANVYFWRPKIGGLFFHFQTIDGSLTLSRIETSDRTTIYKCAHILAYEARLVKDEQDFAWIQEHLPEKCPKNITGFRRMKTQNTKNYQILKSLAADQGRDI